MPNIQMVGYSQEAYSSLKLRIDAVMQSMGLGGDAVTTWIPALVETCDGERTPLPYLRVCSTNPEQIGKIINAFKLADIKEDCEGCLLTGFIPAAEMISNPLRKLEQTGDGPEV